MMRIPTRLHRYGLGAVVVAAAGLLGTGTVSATIQHQSATPPPPAQKDASGSKKKSKERKPGRQGGVGVAAVDVPQEMTAPRKGAALERITRNPEVDVIGFREPKQLSDHWQKLPDGWDHAPAQKRNGRKVVVAWRKAAVPELRGDGDAEFRLVEPEANDPRQAKEAWPADPSMKLRPLRVAGVSFVPGVRDDEDVHTVLKYVAEQYHERVERLVNPGNWGYNYRANRNSPGSLSTHASGTAIDVNAPRHPNGVPAEQTFRPNQIAEIRKILDEVEPAVRWGGDFSTPDAMHFELDADKATVAAVADRLRQEDRPQGRLPEQGRQVVTLAREAIREDIEEDLKRLAR